MTSETPPRIIDGVTGTQRIYVKFIASEAANWRLTIPDYCKDPANASPEQVELAKAAYLSYVSRMFHLFDRWSGKTDGAALCLVMYNLHSAETVAEYKARWAAAKIGTDDCPAYKFVRGLGVDDPFKYPGLKEGVAGNYIRYGTSNVINLLACNVLASWTGLKLLVPSLHWPDRKGQLKIAFMQAVPL